MALVPDTTVALLSERNTIWSRFVDKLQVRTPYGPLICELEFTLTAGGVKAVKYISPFALIWYVCAVSNVAASFFVKHLSLARNRLALYHDAVKPRNSLRPDFGRSFEVGACPSRDVCKWLRSSGCACHSQGMCIGLEALVHVF